MLVLDDLDGFKDQMAAELGHRRFRNGGLIRWHDAGDFFSDRYLLACLEIFRAHPQIRFYAYTKEVERFRLLVEPDPPPNFRWVFSYGGTQDSLLNPSVDRVADVFPDSAGILEAGFHSQEDSDLLAVDGPSPVGIPTNAIRHFQKVQGDRTFSQWQAQADAEAAARRSRRPS